MITTLPPASMDFLAFHRLLIVISVGRGVLHVCGVVAVVVIATSAQYPELQSVFIVVVAVTPFVTTGFVAAFTDTAGITASAEIVVAAMTTAVAVRLLTGDIRTSLIWAGQSAACGFYRMELVIRTDEPT